MPSRSSSPAVSSPDQVDHHAPPPADTCCTLRPKNLALSIAFAQTDTHRLPFCTDVLKKQGLIIQPRIFLIINF